MKPLTQISGVFLLLLAACAPRVPRSACGVWLLTPARGSGTVGMHGKVTIGPDGIMSYQGPESGVIPCHDADAIHRALAGKLEDEYRGVDPVLKVEDFRQSMVRSSDGLVLSLGYVIDLSIGEVSPGTKDVGEQALQMLAGGYRSLAAGFTMDINIPTDDGNRPTAQKAASTVVYRKSGEPEFGEPDVQDFVMIREAPGLGGQQRPQEVAPIAQPEAAPIRRTSAADEPYTHLELGLTMGKRRSNRPEPRIPEHCHGWWVNIDRQRVFELDGSGVCAVMQDDTVVDLADLASFEKAAARSSAALDTVEVMSSWLKHFAQVQAGDDEWRSVIAFEARSSSSDEVLKGAWDVHLDKRTAESLTVGRIVSRSGEVLQGGMTMDVSEFRRILKGTYLSLHEGRPHRSCMREVDLGLVDKGVAYLGELAKELRVERHEIAASMPRGSSLGLSMPRAYFPDPATLHAIRVREYFAIYRHIGAFCGNRVAFDASLGEDIRGTR